jgi:hypothetical protein
MGVRTIGLDIAKHVFQVHGADATGKAVLKKRLRWEQVADFFGSIPRCLVAMEATRGAHYWALVACRRVTDTTVGAPNSSAYRQDDPTE